MHGNCRIYWTCNFRAQGIYILQLMAVCIFKLLFWLFFAYLLANLLFSEFYLSTERYEGVESESAQRCKARLERYRRTAERAVGYCHFVIFEFVCL